MLPTNKKIILFDGVCNLCNGAVRFVIERDRKDIFRFVALQTDMGRQLLAKNNIDQKKTDSIVLVDEGKAFIKSSAALRIAKHLNGGYPILYGFIVLPKIIRNGVYDFIAHNRYRWFGREDACMIPTTALKAKFLGKYEA